MSHAFEKIVPQSPRLEAREDNRLEQEFQQFVHKGGYTVDQIRQAYYDLCGAVESSKVTDPQVREIREQMERMTDAHYPLNRFVEFIGSKEHVEAMIPQYTQLVEGLAVSDNEKRMLVSLVAERRSGTVECRAGDRAVNTFVINGNGASSEMIAGVITDFIRQFLAQIGPGKKYEFWFEEK